jgi:cleavage stimulation factor subunit 3
MKKIEDARKIYERLVGQFPTAGRYWKIYIEHEVSTFSFYLFLVVI